MDDMGGGPLAELAIVPDFELQRSMILKPLLNSIQRLAHGLARLLFSEKIMKKNMNIRAMESIFGVVHILIAIH